jgi:hypothetical protein
MPDQNDLAMRNTADVTGGKPIAVLLQSISGGDVVNPLVAFYDIHGRKRELLFFCSFPDEVCMYLCMYVVLSNCFKTLFIDMQILTKSFYYKVHISIIRCK